MAQEYVEVIDEKTGKPTGRVVSKQEAHRMGYWHLTVHVWILNSRNEILMQKRSSKTTYSEKWYISAGGHVVAGQSSIDAAIRETEEELGITLGASEFVLIFRDTQQIVLNDGAMINNEYNDVYLVRKDIDVSNLKLEEEEVIEVKFIPIDTFKKMVESKDESLVPHFDAYKKLLKHIAR